MAHDDDRFKWVETVHEDAPTKANTEIKADADAIELMPAVVTADKVTKTAGAENNPAPVTPVANAIPTSVNQGAKATTGVVTKDNLQDTITADSQKASQDTIDNKAKSDVAEASANDADYYTNQYHMALTESKMRQWDEARKKYEDQKTEDENKDAAGKRRAKVGAFMDAGLAFAKLLGVKHGATNVNLKQVAPQWAKEEEAKEEKRRAKREGLKERQRQMRDALEQAKLNGISYLASKAQAKESAVAEIAKDDHNAAIKHGYKMEEIGAQGETNKEIAGIKAGASLEATKYKSGLDTTTTKAKIGVQNARIKASSEAAKAKGFTSLNNSRMMANKDPISVEEYNKMWDEIQNPSELDKYNK